MRIVWRLLASLIGAAAVTVVACMALFVTSSPRWVSVLVEPLSLLLMPGVALCMLLIHARDSTQWEILRATLMFYTVVLYGGLWWRARRGVWRGGQQTR